MDSRLAAFLAISLFAVTHLALAKSNGAQGSCLPGLHCKAAPGVSRDANGKIARDSRQLNAFKKQHPCPATGKTYGPCSGYVVDHVIPLKRGGADTPGNMQWQTMADAKAKDRVE